MSESSTMAANRSSATQNLPQQQQQQPPPQPSKVIDLDSVPQQIGHAILRAADGTFLQPPSGSLSEKDVGIIYRMMLEVGTVLDGKEGLQRLSIGFKSVSYAVTLGCGDGCLYIVKKRSSPWW